MNIHSLNVIYVWMCKLIEVDKVHHAFLLVYKDSQVVKSARIIDIDLQWFYMLL